MDGRLLGLSIVIFVFAIVEISAQSFYPNRYGKRDVQVAGEQWLTRGSQYDRRSDPSGNLFFGSRYGKRSYNATPPGEKSLREISGAGDRFGRSPDVKNSDRFFFGSRFGKRSRLPSSSADVSSKSEEYLRSKDMNQEFLLCRYTGFRHIYHCLMETEEGKVFKNIL